MNTLARKIGFGAVLFSLWAGLSGHFSGFFLLLGLASCGLVMWLTARMRSGDQKRTQFPDLWCTLIHAGKYAGWLMREIFLSNLKVARIILDPRLPIRPVLFFSPARQKTDLGRFIFANSITLTPGTISIEIADSGEQILVHTLHEDMSWGAQGCDMDARVCALGV